MTTSNLGRIAVVSQGDWVAGTYKALDIVRYNGAAYIAKVGTSTVPTNTSYWSLLVNDGTVNYTWIKYADDINGTGLSDSPTGKVAIGIAVNKTTATESTTASDYAWSQIKGDAGVSLYTWIKYADDAIGTGLSNTSAGKKYIGIAANKTSTTESTSAGDYEWSLIVGDPLYTWIKYADDSAGGGLSDSPTGKSYIGIAVNKTSATESTIASDYAWSLLGGGSSGGGLLPTAIKTSSYTAAKNELVRCNTTAGAFSISMPASPSDGDIVGIVDIYNTFTTNKLTILPNGGTIEGDATSLVLDISGTYVSFVYNSVTTNWRLLETPSAAATGSGTVTSVAALTLGTAGTDVSSSVANGTTTPVITLNLPDASATARGVLTSTDWSAFNSKQAAITFGANVLAWLGTPTAANLASVVTDETGSGSLVFATSPTLAGIPLAPTAATGTNTTQIATTAFVATNFAALKGTASVYGGAKFSLSGTTLTITTT